MSIQLTNEEKDLFEKEISSVKEQIEELKSLSKVTNKVQSVVLDELESLKTHTGYFNAIEKKED
jgi:hypothetical protein